MSLRIFALLALIAPPTFAAAAAPAPIPRVETIVQHYADLEDFMGAVLVARGDEVLFSKANGSANLELNVPNTVDANSLRWRGSTLSTWPRTRPGTSCSSSATSRSSSSPAPRCATRTRAISC